MSSSVSDLQIETFVDPAFGENSYLLSVQGASGKVGWVIDPGLGQQPQELLAHAAREQIHVEKVVLTHGHADHIAGVDQIRAAWPEAQLLIAAEDEPMLADPHLNLSAPFGFEVVVKTAADGHLAHNGRLQLGPLTWQVLDTSGHSPGGRSFYCSQAKSVITGDALFAGSIGRYDFPGSSGPALLANIRAHMLSLPDDTAVYPGHGPATRIGTERKYNAFLTEA